MGDYNLTGLNETDFEHLTQALALKVVAPGIMPFGEGPDGGREATFRGKMNHPTTADPWDGYLVMQSKFSKRPTGDSKKDGEWALRELKKDLAKFEDLERNLPKPDYYIFVTNMVLTAVQDKGSKDQAIKLLEDHLATTGLKGYDIWDYDKLCRFIDGHQDISNKYAGFITSGDVLAKMMEILKGQQADFAQTMSLFLQSELRADQFAKLEQAGHSADQKTSLAHVFVDLPAFDNPIADRPPNETIVKDLPPGVVAELIEAGSRVLKGSVLIATDSQTSGAEMQSSKQPGRFVIVGGPGQGKSTVSQFVCQLYRAAILKDQPPHTIGAETFTALNLFLQQCVVDRMELPSARRFPVKVVLDEFASEIAKGKVDSLLSYILKRINDASKRHCSASDLRRWLEAYPWLIVLDGLDEVPATSNRTQLLEMVIEFWSEVAILNADILVVATTRPQGYSDDFSPRLYQHRYLAPLSTARALYYSQRLANARYSASVEQRDRVLKRLTMACEQETTARLMRTPLQVTIMATLVDRVGQPPQERWRLFQLYYEVIYQREIEREILASAILRQRKADVDAIHKRVGLLLQTQSEQAGGTESRLSLSSFEELVRSRINEEGYEGIELESRTREITEAALLRLVFLVGLEANNIGFEIRSLQEFMAAEALMDGNENEVRERLATIAPIDHWRNVFLFAAGRCFADRQYLRDSIIGICDQLNEPLNDRLTAATLTGSRLALDVWNDGVAREQRKFDLQLVRLALQLMRLPDDETNLRLSAAYNAVFGSLFEEQIRERLAQASFAERFGAWVVLKALVNQEVPWSIQMADEYWPNDPVEQRRIFELSENTIPEGWVQQKLVDLIPNLNPSRLSSHGLRNIIVATTNQKTQEWTSALSHITKNVHDCLDAILLPASKGDEKIKLVLGGLQRPDWKNLIPLKNMPLKHSGWAPYIAAARFAEAPNAQSLSRELSWLSSLWHLNFRTHNIDLPWPIAACLLASANQDDLSTLSRKAAAGQLGSYEDWILAEERWRERGITSQDLVCLTNDWWPFNNEIRSVGYPLAASYLDLSDTDFSFAWSLLGTCHEDSVGEKARARFGELIHDIFEFLVMVPSGHTLNIQPDQLKQIYQEQSKPAFYIDLLRMMDLPEQLGEDWIDFFDWLGQQEKGQFFVGHRPWKEANLLASAYIADPRRLGIFEVLSTLVLSGSKCSVPKELIINHLNGEDHRLSALFLRLAQDDWNEEEAVQLATVAEQCASKEGADEETLDSTGTDVIGFVCLILRRHRIDTVNKEAFLLALWDKLDSTHSEHLYKVVDLLNLMMAWRNSGLKAKGRWEELGLPALNIESTS